MFPVRKIKYPPGRRMRCISRYMFAGSVMCSITLRDMTTSMDSSGRAVSVKSRLTRRRPGIALSKFTTSSPTSSWAAPRNFRSTGAPWPHPASRRASSGRRCFLTTSSNIAYGWTESPKYFSASRSAHGLMLIWRFSSSCGATANENMSVADCMARKEDSIHLLPMSLPFALAEMPLCHWNERHDSLPEDRSAYGIAAIFVSGDRRTFVRASRCAIMS